MCRSENERQGYNYSGEKTTSSGGGGSKPLPGTSRTASGGTLMVTPDGKQWVWNGKYNTVATLETKDGHIAEYQLIMQGDPAVTSTHIVNGKRLNDADPNYMAEADAAAAKMKAGQQANKAGVQKATNQQSKDYIDSAKDPGGVLQRGGTKVLKEDVDVPPSHGKSGTGSTATSAGASANVATPHPVSPPLAADDRKKKPAASVPVSPPPAAANIGRSPSGSAGLQAR
jgi:hypothetical protein